MLDISYGQAQAGSRAAAGIAVEARADDRLSRRLRQAAEASGLAVTGAAGPVLLGGSAANWRRWTLAAKTAGVPDLAAAAIATAAAAGQKKHWTVRAAGAVLRLSRRRPHIMGIVNVTPDSFSDGGRFLVPEQAVEQGLRLAAAGADSLDLGAESTRPGARPVPAAEQKRRLEPVLRALRRQTRLPLSVDTASSQVAEAALDWGAAIINDVTALRGDTAMAAVIARHKAAVILMHMRGTPRTMQKNTTYRAVMPQIITFLRQRAEAAIQAGISAERIMVDPGIGFGKSAAQNYTLIHRGRDFSQLGLPVVFGVSRKSFIASVVDVPPADRDNGTLAAALWLAGQGVAVLRVHNVAAVAQALRVQQAIAAASW